jgi:uncharacterized membrane protein
MPCSRKEVNMLSSDGAWARLIFSFCLFFLSGSEMITGWPATFAGVAGTVELATALLRYSPLQELIQLFNQQQAKQSEPTH